MSAPRGRRPQDRVAIIVSGGVVQDVICDIPHDMILIDYDNIEQGDGVCAYACTDDRSALDAALKAARLEVARVREMRKT